MTCSFREEVITGSINHGLKPTRKATIRCQDISKAGQGTDTGTCQSQGYKGSLTSRNARSLVDLTADSPATGKVNQKATSLRVKSQEAHAKGKAYGDALKLKQLVMKRATSTSREVMKSDSSHGATSKVSGVTLTKKKRKWNGNKLKAKKAKRSSNTSTPQQEVCAATVKMAVRFSNQPAVSI